MPSETDEPLKERKNDEIMKASIESSSEILKPYVLWKHCFYIHIASGIFAIRDRSRHNICGIIQISMSDSSKWNM